MVYLRALGSWRDGQPNIAHGTETKNKELEILSVEHGICPIAEFTSSWLNCPHSNRIPYPLFCWCRDVHVLLKNIKWMLKSHYGDFSIFQMATAAMLDFWNYKLLTVGYIISDELRQRAKFRGDWSICCHSIYDFSRWWQPPSWIFTILFVTIRTVKKDEMCQILSKSLKLQEICQFSIFQHGGRRHLGFLKFQIINGQDAQEGWTASSCQISSKSLRTRMRYSDF